MASDAEQASRPTNEGSRRELPPVQCHVCGDALRSEWVYLSARALAGRLYTLDLCGVCWPLLEAVIRTETEGYTPERPRSKFEELHLQLGARRRIHRRKAPP